MKIDRIGENPHARPPLVRRDFSTLGGLMGLLRSLNERLSDDHRIRLRREDRYNEQSVVIDFEVEIDEHGSIVLVYREAL